MPVATGPSVLEALLGKPMSAVPKSEAASAEGIEAPAFDEAQPIAGIPSQVKQEVSSPNNHAPMGSLVTAEARGRGRRS